MFSAGTQPANDTRTDLLPPSIDEKVGEDVATPTKETDDVVVVVLEEGMSREPQEPEPIPEGDPTTDITRHQ